MASKRSAYRIEARIVVRQSSHPDKEIAFAKRLPVVFHVRSS
jgi:hypothetical protein